MLTGYIRAAMRQARYELIEDDGSFYGEIPGFQGVWSNAATLESCRDELRDVLEAWLVLGLRRNDPLPIVDGIELAIKEPRDAADRPDPPERVDSLSETA